MSYSCYDVWFLLSIFLELNWKKVIAPKCLSKRDNLFILVGLDLSENKFDSNTVIISKSFYRSSAEVHKSFLKSILKLWGKVYF